MGFLDPRNIAWSGGQAYVTSRNPFQGSLTHIGTFRRHWTPLDPTGRPIGSIFSDSYLLKEKDLKKIGCSSGKSTSYTVLEKYSLVWWKHLQVILLSPEKMIFNLYFVALSTLLAFVVSSSKINIFSHTYCTDVLKLDLESSTHILSMENRFAANYKPTSHTWSDDIPKCFLEFYRCFLNFLEMSFFQKYG